MGGVRVQWAGAVCAMALAAAVAVCPPAAARVPVPTDNAFVIPGANSDGWAPAILEPIDPWATDGPLVPLINANYYDCAGCAVTIIRYPRTAGPLFGPGAPAADTSVAIGTGLALADLSTATGRSVISGLSLGAMVADDVQRALGADPHPPAPPEVTFIVSGDPSRVTPFSTGIGSFFPVGVRLPVLGWTVTRPPAESIYDTVVVVGEYEWAADFPDRPWNLLADLNALVGFNYNHSEASLTDPADIPPQNIVTTTNSTGATTTTYLVPSPQVPLLKPLKGILAPAVISAANDVLKPIVDRGYSRYDALTGNHLPYLQPTGGLPKLVMPGDPAGPSPAPTAARRAVAVPGSAARDARAGESTSAPAQSGHSRRGS